MPPGWVRSPLVLLDANGCVLPCVSRDPLHRLPYSLPIFQEPGPTAGRGLGSPELGLGASALSGSVCSLAMDGDPWKPRRYSQAPRPIVEPSLLCSPGSSVFLLLSISQTCAAPQVWVLPQV